MKKSYTILVGIFLLYAAPLSGGLIRGLPSGFFRFPPVLMKAGDTLEFSWPFYLMCCVFFAMALAVLAGPENFGFRPKKRRPCSDEDLSARDEKKHPRLPSWGRVGGVLMCFSWCLAWGRFDWLGPLRDYIFFPLWLGYVLLIDGLVYRRRSTSLFAHAQKGFWLLFPISALLWWYFEYLNRFVQNWWYEGVQDYSAFRYVLYGSLCFSTVLPAVFETCELVLSFDYVKRSFACGPVRKAHSDIYAFSCMCAGILGLFLAGLFPHVFFALVWLAPLAIVVGTLGFCRTPSPFRSLQKGNYALPVALAMASLLCGLLWELWNMYSMPQWHYSIPYLSKFRIFEMPLPGYSGYLPFGLSCWAGWLLLSHLMPNRWQAHSDAMQRHMEQMAACGTETPDGKQDA